MVGIGRPKIDPELKAQRQKECRRMWRLNNRDQFNESKKKSANKRYAVDEAFRERCKALSTAAYCYKREASAFAAILIS